MPNRIFSNIIRTIADEIDRHQNHDVVHKNHNNSVKTFYSDNHRHITCYVNLGDKVVKDYKVISDEIQLAVAKIVESHMPLDVIKTEPESNNVSNTLPISESNIVSNT